MGLHGYPGGLIGTMGSHGYPMETPEYLWAPLGTHGYPLVPVLVSSSDFWFVSVVFVFNARRRMGWVAGWSDGRAMKHF